MLSVKKIYAIVHNGMMYVIAIHLNTCDLLYENLTYNTKIEF